MIYRPVRERSLDKLLEQAEKLVESTGYEEISLTSLSSSDYSRLEDLARQLMNRYKDSCIGLSLPSLRLDSFEKDFLEEMQKVRKTGLTFAPEAGTQRLRDVINKGVTEEDLINTVTDALSSGWSSIKALLYDRTANGNRRGSAGNSRYVQTCEKNLLQHG